MADSKAVQQIGDADFDSVLNGGKPVFVDFWAPWCGPCRIVGPIVEDLAPSYDGKAVIAKLNVDDNPMVAQRYGVTSIPTMMMFKDGKLVDRMVGAAPKARCRTSSTAICKNCCLLRRGSPSGLPRFVFSVPSVSSVPLW